MRYGGTVLCCDCSLRGISGLDWVVEVLERRDVLGKGRWVLLLGCQVTCVFLL